MNHSTIARFTAGAAAAVAAMLVAPGVGTAQIPPDDVLDLDATVAPAEVAVDATVTIDDDSQIAGADAPVNLSAGTTVEGVSVSATPSLRAAPTIELGPAGASAPVTVCGNSVGVLADASSSCAPSSPAQPGGADAVSVVAPVTVCGNSVSVLADASGACTPAAASPAPASATASPSTADVFLPLAVCGTRVSVLSDGATSCTEAPGSAPASGTSRIDGLTSPGGGGGSATGSSAARSITAVSDAAGANTASIAGGGLPLPTTGATILGLVTVAALTLGAGGVARLLGRHPAAE